MKAQAINGIISSAYAICDAVRKVAIWGTHTVQAGFANHVVPTIKAIWSGVLTAIKTSVNFLRTGPGFAIAAAAGLAAFGVVALRLSLEKDYDEQEHQINQNTWRAAGVTSIAAAVAGVGLALFVL